MELSALDPKPHVVRLTARATTLIFDTSFYHQLWANERAAALFGGNEVSYDGMGFNTMAAMQPLIDDNLGEEWTPCAHFALAFEGGLSSQLRRICLDPQYPIMINDPRVFGRTRWDEVDSHDYSRALGAVRAGLRAAGSSFRGSLAFAIDRERDVADINEVLRRMKEGVLLSAYRQA